MELVQALKERRSIRKFKKEPIAHEIIEQIVEEASYAPSWKHTQIPRYVYIEDKELICKIAEDMILEFEFNAKTLQSCAGVMVVTYVTKRSGYERDGSYSTPKEDRFEMFDAGVASQSVCLSAYGKGIGTVITGYFDEEKISELLEIPKEQKIGSLICMGYPDESPVAPKRKAVSDLLRFK